MGIDIRFRAVYGVKIRWDDNFNEAYDEAYDDQDTPNVVIEGMSGSYIILGENLFTSDNFRWMDGDGDTFKTIDPYILSSLEEKYRVAFTKKFPDFIHHLNSPFQLHIFVEYR